MRPPLHYWETHAGSACYPMTETPEILHGAIRFARCASGDPDLQDSAYLNALKSDPDTYPGSPMLAIRTLGKNADYLFCDLDPESLATLREATAAVDARIIGEDGVSAIGREAEFAGINPAGVVVHIDPFDPHERLTPGSKTPIELAGFLARAGYRVVYWYGYGSAEKRGWALREIAELAPDAKLWCGDALMPAPFVYSDMQGAWGCGVVLANATTQEMKMCERLGHAVARINETDVSKDNDPARLTFEVLS